MQDQHSPNSEPVNLEAQKEQTGRSRWASRLPFGLAAAVTAIALAAGSGTAWWVMQSVKDPVRTTTATPLAQQPEQLAPPTTIAPADPIDGAAQSPVAPSPTAPAQIEEQTAQVYWLTETGGQIKLVAAPVAIAASAQPEAKLRSALEALLTQAPTGDAASTIPQGTALRSVSIEPDGIHVDLSSEFKTGGGSTSMSGRLGQIVYTATTIDPTAKVWISVQGEPLQVLGGEGIEVDQPMTRQNFDENFAL